MISSFKEFWPFYLSQHENKINMALHIAGTTLGLLCLVCAVFWSLHFLWLGLLVSYGLAWTGHFLIEKNRPATFRYPFWSLLADLKMTGLFWVGLLPKIKKSHAD